MCVAYLVMVHKNSEQFKRLFRAIYHPANYYLIHVDKKSKPEIHKETENFLSEYSNVFILESQNVNWGGYSVLRPEIEAIKKLLEINSDWQFFINLSGQDFPLKTQDYIHSFLNCHKTCNFFKVSDQRRDWYASYFRVRVIFFEFGSPVNKVLPFPMFRQFPASITPYIGSQMFIATRDFCNYVLESRLSKKLQKYYKNTFVPDEGFFQTLIMNSPFKKTVVRDNMRIIQTKKPNSGALHPTILTKEDYSFLIQSGNLFARKFDESVDSEIMDMLEEHLLKQDKLIPRKT